MSNSARLLVADDNRVNRLLLTRSLELLGHGVATAENGRVALDMLRADRYDLLLLDMEMPEMDGFAVLDAMKHDTSLRDVPVIVTSSLEGIDHVVRCIELGAEDYLPKPVNAGAAQGAHRRQPREEAPARPPARAPATVRNTGGRARPRAVGLLARGTTGARHRDVRRHPGLHAARRSAGPRGGDRPSQQLVRADVRRHRRPRRHRHAHAGRRPHGRVRRAARARGPRGRRRRMPRSR